LPNGYTLRTPISGNSVPLAPASAVQPARSVAVRRGHIVRSGAHAGCTFLQAQFDRSSRCTANPPIERSRQELGIAFDNSMRVHPLNVYVAAIRNFAPPAARWTHRCTLTAARAHAPSTHNPEQSMHHTPNTAPCRRPFGDHAPLSAFRPNIPHR